MVDPDKPIFGGQWDSAEAMVNDFAPYDADYNRKTEAVDLAGCELLAAAYTDQNYSGSAFVLFRNAAGVLLCVEGGHCSCHGLEGQWSPTPTTWAAQALQWKEREFGPQIAEELRNFTEELRALIDRNVGMSPENKVGGSE